MGWLWAPYVLDVIGHIYWCIHTYFEGTSAIALCGFKQVTSDLKLLNPNYGCGNRGLPSEDRSHFGHAHARALATWRSSCGTLLQPSD